MKTMARAVNSRGFTLIEILIVILIISIVSGVAVISMSTNHQQQSRREAMQLAHEIELAEQEALLRPATLGMSVVNNAVIFSLAVQNTTTLTTRWLPFTEKIFRPHHFTGTLQLKPNTRVIIGPDGSLTPFILFIGGPDGSVDWRIIGKANGEIQLENVHDQQK